MSTSAAQINGEALASDNEPGHGNSSAPDRCCIAVNARPRYARSIFVLESDAALESGAAESNGTVPFVTLILLVTTKAKMKFNVNKVTVP